MKIRMAKACGFYHFLSIRTSIFTGNKKSACAKATADKRGRLVLTA
jgi:hypothetical protein